MGRLTLVLGGAKSGKSSWAQSRCEDFPGPRLYVATAEAYDQEMSERIFRHQAARGPLWRTVEEPLDPPAVIRRLKPGDATVVLLDCLTLWLSNLMAGQELNVDQAVERVQTLAEVVVDAPVPVYVVSNEVGQGIVPDNKLARNFRDAAGMGHQILARTAEEVIFVTAGLAHRLK